jgi:hypothetical protein
MTVSHDQPTCAALATFSVIRLRLQLSSRRSPIWGRRLT